MENINKPYQYINIIIFVSLCLLCTFDLSAQLKFQGYGAAGYKKYNRSTLKEINEKTYYEVKLESKVKINSEISSEFDLHGDSDDQIAKFKEFSLKFDYFDYLKFKVGNIKKPFGIEQLTSRDEYLTIDDSFLKRKLSDMNYGGRAVSISAYYKNEIEKNRYKKDKSQKSKKKSKNNDEEVADDNENTDTDDSVENEKENYDAFPYSYYLAIFKDNSLNTGISGRFSYFHDDFSYSAGYMFISKSEAYPIDIFGLEADLVYRNSAFYSDLEICYVQDPAQSVIQMMIAKDKISSTGIKSTSSMIFNIDGKIIRKIEPLFLAGIFYPDINELKSYIIQLVFGTDFYFSKKVKLRLNGDLLLSKNQFSSKYNTYDSRLTIEFFVNY
jgi:hypothetical protein